MKFRKLMKSKKTLALALITVLLFAGSGIMGARAQLTIQSQEYRGDFELDHLSVALVENGVQTRKQNETLLQHMKQKVQPGLVYKEEISAENTSDIKHFLRLTIRKYWMKDGKKDVTKDPALIKLYYNKEGQYNTSRWKENKDETTAERTVYYYTSVLPGGGKTVPVVNKLSVDGSVLDDVTVTEKDGAEAGEKIYTYHYDYDGYDICVEADVQALQTHNINDAIKSIWGVQNVSVSGDTLTVQ